MPGLSVRRNLLVCIQLPMDEGDQLPSLSQTTTELFNSCVSKLHVYEILSPVKYGGVSFVVFEASSGVAGASVMLHSTKKNIM